MNRMPPKSPAQRKEEFEKKQKDAGRSATIIHLSQEAKKQLAKLRALGRRSKDGPSTNAEILDKLLTSEVVFGVISSAVNDDAGSIRGNGSDNASNARAPLDLMDDQIEFGMHRDDILIQHKALHHKWSSNAAKLVASRFGLEGNLDDLRWLLHDLVDDYVEEISS